MPESQSSASQPYRLFSYYPSLPLEIFFAVAFFCSVLLHSVQLLKYRTWFFLPFVIGGYFETIGFVGRAFLAADSPNWKLSLYIMQTLLLLLAPTLFAGSIYMILSRIIRLTDGQKLSLVPVKWLTIAFVSGDLLSFLIQGAGGGSLASAKTLEAKNRGRTLIIIGLLVQLATFVLFILVTSVFYCRIKSTPTPLSKTLETPWKPHVKLLILECLLILFRSIFRLVEYVMGTNGPLMTKEIFTILLDSTLMLLCMLLFNLFHPYQAMNANTDNPTVIPVLESKETKLEPNNEEMKIGH